MDAQQASGIVATIDNANLVTGQPGSWAINNGNMFMLINRHFAGGAALAGAPSLPPATAAIAQAAVDKSNHAAEQTPAVASGQEASSKTPTDIISAILQQLQVVANVAQDIQDIEAGGTAKLHWWGWEAKLNEKATKGLLHLLGADMTSVSAIALALTTISPVFAAIGGILAIVSNTFVKEITDADTNGNGVSLKGYLFIALSASAL